MKMTPTHTLSMLALVGLTACAALTIFIPAQAKSPSYHLINKMTVGGDGGWDYVYLDSGTRTLYVTRGTHVMIINVDTHKVIGDIPDLNGIHGVAIDPWSGLGFISNGRGNSVVMFDIKTLAKTKEIPVGTGPDAIIYDQQTKRVYSFNGRDKSFTAIDGNNGNVLGTFTLPGRPEFPASDGNGHIYDNIEDMSEVVSIAATSNTIDKTWPIAPGEGPSGLAYDGNHNRVYSVCDNKLLTVLDPTTGKVVTTLPIGNGPDACSFDPGINMLYSPNGEDGTMTVYQVTAPDTYKLVTTFNTMPGARTMTVDLKTHHLWTVSAVPDPNAPTGRRRAYLPGSFVVLEYGK